MQKQRKYKMKFVQGLIIIAGILVIAIILGHHIIVRTSATASSNDFTSYMLAKQAKNSVNKFLEGDVDAFLKDMFRDNDNTERHMENYDEFLEDVKKEVKEIYNEEIKGKNYKIKVDMINLQSIDAYNAEKTTSIGVKVEIEGSEPIRFTYDFVNYNTYSLSYISSDVEEIDYTKGLGRLLGIFDTEYMGTESMYILRKNISESFIESLWDDYEKRDGTLGSIFNLEDGTYKGLYDRLVELFKKGVKIESCSFVNEIYDTEDKCVKGEMILVLSDKKDNKVVLIQECTGISFEREDKNTVILSKRYARDKDAEVIGSGLEGVSNKDLKKLFRLEK